MVASEASGEQLGASLVAASRAAGLDLDFAGVVGPHLQAMGVRSRFDGEVLAVMGLVEVLGRIGKIRQLLRDIEHHFREQRPVLAVLIDHPDFNLRVAALAKAQGIPVLYYVSPQVWAWRARRVQRIASLVDHMMVLFPFEAPIYEEAGLPATVVSHPLLEKTAQAPGREEARRLLDLTPGTWIAMLPGSRNSEVQRIGPRLAQSAKLLAKRRRDLRFVVPLARPEQRAGFERLWREAGNADLPMMLEGQAALAIRAADVVVVASGTATLETALLGRPAVVVYAMHPLTFAIARRLVKLPHVALPNIILKQKVYPELLQGDFTPARVADAVLQILDGAGQAQERALTALPGLLAGEGGERVIAILRDLLEKSRENA